MNTSASYTEMIQRVYKPSRQEGSRPYPVSCFEILLLMRTQERLSRQEAERFIQFSVIFDWAMLRQQRNTYLRQLREGHTLVLTDLSKRILWTSRNFLSMTGYTPAEVLGRSPGLLQGPATDRATVRWMSESLARAEAVSADLLNYRKGGEPYYCRVAIEPIYNRQGELTHFLAVEHELG